MRLVLALIVAAIVLSLPTIPALASDSSGHYGAGFSKTRSVAVSDATPSPRRVRIKGTIVDVCPNSGCWIVVSDGERQMKVTFKNHSFTVPREVLGRQVEAEGVVSRVGRRRSAVSMVATGVEVD
jgi:hypothetical protein